MESGQTSKEWKTSKEDATNAVINLINSGVNGNEAMIQVINSQYIGINKGNGELELLEQVRLWIQGINYSGCNLCGGDNAIKVCTNCALKYCKSCMSSPNGGVEYCILCDPDFLLAVSN